MLSATAWGGIAGDEDSISVDVLAAGGTGKDMDDESPIHVTIDTGR